jgi:hypothetical protein
LETTKLMSNLVASMRATVLRSLFLDIAPVERFGIAAHDTHVADGTLGSSRVRRLVDPSGKRPCFGKAEEAKPSPLAAFLWTT